MGAQDAHPRPRLLAHCACITPRPRAQRVLGAVSWHIKRCIVAPGCRVASCLLPYHPPPPPPPHAIQNCIVTLRTMSPRAPDCVAARCCHVAALYRSPAAPYCDTNSRPQPRYDFCIVTHPMAKPCARASLAPTLRPTVSWPLLAVSWGSVAGPSGRIMAHLQHAPAPCVMIQSIVS